MQTAVFRDSTGLIKIDVWMPFQFIERKMVDVKLDGQGLFNDEVFLGIKGKILDFI